MSDAERRLHDPMAPVQTQQEALDTNYSVPEAEPQPTPAFRQHYALLCLLHRVTSTYLPGFNIGCTTDVSLGDKQQLHLVLGECRVWEVAGSGSCNLLASETDQKVAYF